eukprot:TRINITY_DN23139_c0_g1_i1.p1 TRINITY_DN23139_c0_g1~~TRINITY_DN23139_c0_g1_i1.p1  ORF type:complete len:436 (+),score=55.03 TRINITY_DN23139_c0_g1_i1:28-1308(+)
MAEPLTEHSTRTPRYDCCAEATVTPERFSAESALANELMMSHLAHERAPAGLERQSVYGAAILIPQVGRSLGWPRTFVGLFILVHLWVFLNFFMQLMLLAFIERAENIMDLFSSQMFLCDYGIGSLGPGGTEVSGPRLYGYSTWNLRNFVQSSLISAFPDQEDKIRSTVDPGEYGVESKLCRYICCFICILNLTSEFHSIVMMCRLLYHVPTRRDSWCTVRPDDKDSGQGVPPLDRLSIRVAGMPLVWKCIITAVLLIPKTLMWRLTMQASITFLMETSAIDDMIVNAVAINFILEIDELVCSSLLSGPMKELLDSCEDYQLPDAPASPSASYVQCGGSSAPSSPTVGGYLKILVPLRFLLAVGLTVALVLEYYLSHCKLVDGQFVSNDMYEPTTTSLSVSTLLAPYFYPVPHESKPFWTHEDGYL